jgi:GDPmannose 4,6-dehydratase
VTKKITREIARLLHGKTNVITLGNLNAKRDWGYAPEYCEGMWRMLQHDVADDFVLATGESRSVREFLELAFANVGIEIEWRGTGTDEQGVISSVDEHVLAAKAGIDRFARVNDVVVAIDPSYYRPTEVDALIGDYSKAEKILGWTPVTRLDELVRIMIDADLEAIRNPVAEF